MDEKKKMIRTSEITKNSYCFFSCNFNNSSLDIKPIISIGLCDAYGRTFYAEISDNNKNDLSTDLIQYIDNLELNDGYFDNTTDHYKIKGTYESVSKLLNQWLNNNYISKGIKIQFVNDFNPVEFVLLIKLLSNQEILQNVCSTCIQLNHDMALFINMVESDDIVMDYPDEIAFKINRNDFTDKIEAFNISGNERNSLYKALQIRAIHQFLYNLV